MMLTAWVARSVLKRRLLRTGLFAFLLATGSGMSYADDLQDILQILAAKPIVRANFEQDKTLPALKKPLHSEGHLLFSRTRGMLWYLQKPVVAELVMTPNRLLQKTAHTQSSLTLGQSPYAAAIGLLLQLQNGDAEKIQHAFNVISAHKTGANWTLVLSPKDRALQKVFAQLQTKGDSYLREIHISEPSGGSTHLRFINPHSDPQLLSDDEQALFSLAD